MMDRSFGSSSTMIRDVPSNYEIAATYSCTEEEESGWTKYFEDFSNNKRADQEQTSFCSSLVSDASSGAACRVYNFVPTKLKKTRTKKVGDHDLEDTASSPVNSPKIGDFRPVDHMNPRKIDDPRININSLGEEHFAEMKQAGENSSDCPGKNGENTDLKKKGLCLVPLNLIVNYLV
ncbi:vascular-related unknown protein 1 [Argentina anserina]|uniref:vascular-related unknown protein 1 n=1 Tax=Argentina anserina TaxID=57926 RepID=UPI0021767EBC|nr:vascular-related unknown protein 1 [Potentilla anserina]